MSVNGSTSLFSSILGFYDQHICEIATAASTVITSYLPINDIFYFPQNSLEQAMRMTDANLLPPDKPSINAALPPPSSPASPAPLINSNDHYNYTFKFPFERTFDSHDHVNAMRQWMQLNWRHSFLYALIYVTVLFVGRVYMRSRSKFELRLLLTIWNTMLAVFSLVGAVRVFPEFFYAVFQRGVVYSVCDSSYAYGVTGFWAYMFIMSKLPELVDTIFIVLRKQELIFLHWYHHATVLIYCWYSYHNFTASGRWFMTMNYLVHSLMYSYYALKAMKIRVPRQIAQLITFGQLAQMCFGCYVNYVAWQTKVHAAHIPCEISNDNIKYSFLMYLSYFILFFHFFLHAYVVGGGRIRPVTPTKSLATATNNNKKALDNNNNSNGNDKNASPRVRKNK